MPTRSEPDLILEPLRSEILKFRILPNVMFDHWLGKNDTKAPAKNERRMAQNGKKMKNHPNSNNVEPGHQETVHDEVDHSHPH
jgi:hypothetical protein